MIDLYSVFTANGQKVHVMLEECGLAYRPHAMDLHGGAHRTAEFRKLNPFGRVPVIVDQDHQGGAPFSVSETSAILSYLAEKTGRLMPKDIQGRAEVQQWLSFVAANIGPLFRGIFMFGTILPGGNPAAVSYFIAEAEKALGLVDAHLLGRDWLAGSEYSIADISLYPVCATSAKQLPKGVEPYANVRRWMATVAARPAVERGMKVLAPQ